MKTKLLAIAAVLALAACTSAPPRALAGPNPLEFPGDPAPSARELHAKNIRQITDPR